MKQVKKYLPCGINSFGGNETITNRLFDTKKAAMEAVSKGEINIAPGLLVTYQEVYRLEAETEEKEEAEKGAQD